MMELSEIGTWKQLAAAFSERVTAEEDPARKKEAARDLIAACRAACCELETDCDPKRCGVPETDCIDPKRCGASDCIDSLRAARDRMFVLGNALEAAFPDDPEFRGEMLSAWTCGIRLQEMLIEEVKVSGEADDETVRDERTLLAEYLRRVSDYRPDSN